jgi:hypothetical protein
MDAGVDKRALAKTVVQYKSKLGGPFATSRMLSEYLKVRRFLFQDCLLAFSFESFLVF